MAKLLFKQNPFDNSIISSITNSLDYLNSAINEAYSMSIPSGFFGKTGLVNCRDQLISIRKKLINLKDWGNTSIKVFNTSLNEMNSTARILPKSRITPRKAIVK